MIEGIPRTRDHGYRNRSGMSLAVGVCSVFAIAMLAPSCSSGSGNHGGGGNDGNTCRAETAPGSNICYPANEQGPFPAVSEYATTATASVNGGAGANLPKQNYFAWSAEANTRTVRYALPLGDPTSATANPTNH